jgi:hypothetical protein
VKKLAKELVKSSKKLKGLKLKDMASAEKSLPVVLEAVEAYSKVEPLPSDMKKELAAEVVNLLVDIPFMPESLEGVLIRRMMGVSIGVLNSLFGKNWLSKAD